jgi:glycosyltransferase involved in cell wall biosynthesis
LVDRFSTMYEDSIIEDDSVEIAVVQGDWGGGGAEKVTKILSRTLNADLFYGFEKEEISGLDDDLNPTQLFNSGWLSSLGSYRDFKYFWSGSNIKKLYEYDIIVQSGNHLSWFVPKDKQTIVRYCHTTPRVPYDMYHKNTGSTFTRLYSMFVRALYPQTASYTTRWICNSDIVKRRLQKYVSVEDSDLEVIYPPVNTEKWDVENETQDDLYVTWSRLDKSKRVHLIAEAFKNRDERLVIMGDGEEKTKIKKISENADNIEVWGYTDEDKLVNTVSKASAVIYTPENEDFGLVPIEAAASGTPCLSVDDGFSKYQIKEGVNGYTHNGTVESINKTVDKFRSKDVDYSSAELKDWATQFDINRFKQSIIEEVNKAWKHDKINTNIEWI